MDCMSSHVMHSAAQLLSPLAAAGSLTPVAEASQMHPGSPK